MARRATEEQFVKTRGPVFEYNNNYAGVIAFSGAGEKRKTRAVSLDAVEYVDGDTRPSVAQQHDRVTRRFRPIVVHVRFVVVAVRLRGLRTIAQRRQIQQFFRSQQKQGRDNDDNGHRCDGHVVR